MLGCALSGGFVPASSNWSLDGRHLGVYVDGCVTMQTLVAWTASHVALGVDCVPTRPGYLVGVTSGRDNA